MKSGEITIIYVTRYQGVTTVDSIFEAFKLSYEKLCGTDFASIRGEMGDVEFIIRWKDKLGGGGTLR